MRVVDCAIVCEGPVHPTRRYYGKLALEVDEGFQHRLHAADRAPGGRRVVVRADQRLPLAVIAEVRRLEHRWTAQAFQRLHDAH